MAVCSWFPALRAVASVWGFGCTARHFGGMSMATPRLATSTCVQPLSSVRLVNDPVGDADAIGLGVEVGVAAAVGTALVATSVGAEHAGAARMTMKGQAQRTGAAS